MDEIDSKYDNGKDEKSKLYGYVVSIFILLIGIILVFVYGRLLPLPIAFGFILLFWSLEWLEWDYIRPAQVHFTQNGMFLIYNHRKMKFIDYRRIEAIRMNGEEASVPVMMRVRGMRRRVDLTLEIGLEVQKRFREISGTQAPSWELGSRRAS
jgi:hypothetical protein